MSFINKITEYFAYVVTYTTKTINKAIDAVSTKLDDVAISGDKPVSLRERILNTYKDFLLFLHKNIYTKMGAKQSLYQSYQQNEFLRLVAQVSLSFSQQVIKEKFIKEYQIKDIKEIVSVQDFMKRKDVESNFSYHVDGCEINKIAKNAGNVMKR